MQLSRFDEFFHFNHVYTHTHMRKHTHSHTHRGKLAVNASHATIKFVSMGFICLHIQRGSQFLHTLFPQFDIPKCMCDGTCCSVFMFATAFGGEVKNAPATPLMQLNEIDGLSNKLPLLQREFPGVAQNLELRQNITQLVAKVPIKWNAP